MLKLKVAQFFSKVAQNVAKSVSISKGTFFKIAQKSLYIWATFKTKYFTQNFRKSPNLVTLSPSRRRGAFDYFILPKVFEIEGLEKLPKLMVNICQSWWSMIGNQCDQIGRFSKVLGEIFCFKSSPNVQWLLGYLEKGPFSDKNCFVNILGNFWKNLGHF